MKKIIFIALIFAIITGIAVFNFAQYLQSAKQTEKGVVVVAVSKIPENTLITSDMVTLKKLPEESINPLAVHDLSQVIGRISNVAIEADEQVLSTKLNQQGTDKNGLAYIVPAGKRAITIEVNNISGVGGFIQKTNRVDIIAMLMMDGISGGKTEKISKSVLLLQNIEVLETNATTSKDEKVNYTNLTVAVSPEEAVKLFYAQSNGKLTIMLRPILDTNMSGVIPYAP